MTGTTATNNLVYPTSGDRLIDQGKYTRDLAVALDNRLLSHDTDIARSDRPPFALVERTTQKDYSLNLAGNIERIDFESVLEDTNDCVALETDSRVITLNKFGWWQVGMYAKILGSNCNPGYVDFIISDETNDVVNNGHDAQVGFVAGASEHISRVTFSTTGFPKLTCRLSFNGSNCNAVYTILYARMWAYWVRDL